MTSQVDEEPEQKVVVRLCRKCGLVYGEVTHERMEEVSDDIKIDPFYGTTDLFCERRITPDGLKKSTDLVPSFDAKVEER